MNTSFCPYKHPTTNENKISTIEQPFHDNNNSNTLLSIFINTHYPIHTPPLNNTKDAMNSSTPNQPFLDVTDTIHPTHPQTILQQPSSFPSARSVVRQTNESLSMS